jgi:trimethylamine:corrinoid methyltransferase-like protein
LAEEDRLDQDQYNRVFEPTMRPHQDRRPMDALFEEEARRTRAAAALGTGENVRTPEDADRAIARNRERLDRVHAAVDRVQDIVGHRQRTDYQALDLYFRHGCDETEALVGHFYMNREWIEPSRVRQALNLTDEQFRATLARFLQRSQHIDDATPAIRSYLTGRPIIGVHEPR